MPRAKSERARSKAAAIEDLTHSLEQLQAILPKIEDLGREGFPYLDGARARTEIQLRECIKRAFGERSAEYQRYRHHTLPVGSPDETRQTIALLKTLMATLEDKKLELQGLKPPPVEEPAAPAPPARPQMTLVPPTTPPPQVTITSMAPVTPAPVTTAVPLATNVDTVAPVAVPPQVQPAAPAAPSAPIVQTVPPTPPQPPPQPPAPQPVAATPAAAPVRPQDTGSVPPPPPAAQARLSTTQEVPMPIQPPAPPAPSAAPPNVAPGLSRTQEIRPQAQRPAENNTPAVPHPAPAPEFAHLEVAKNICQRFHLVARQLRLRGEYRTTLEVEDEFDAQDLLHALLRLQFDDIGTDEWTPGYTNGAPRTTFLLNHDRLAIVVKKTRTGLSPKELTDQVRVDIERYRTRERCTGLLCFIYDPEGRIGNPRGLETDLTTVSDTFTVDILVAPK